MAGWPSVATESASVTAPSPRLMAPGTLSRQLVTRICAIVAAIALTLSALSTLVVRQILVRQVDTQVVQALGGSANRSDAGGSLGFGGLPVGSVVITRYAGATDVSGCIETQDRLNCLPTTDAVATALTALPTNGSIRTVLLPGLGTFRAAAASGILQTNRIRAPGSAWVAIPLDRVNDVTKRMLAAEGLLILIAIGASALAALAVVRTSLRPLNQLAATANAVSSMDLDSGPVNLPARVPDAVIDPRSEVGRVSRSFNQMLDNVEGALQTREASESRIRQFVADASHELRNPLAAIRGYADLSMHRSSDLPPDTVTALSRIQSESRRMGTLVEDMLLLARLDNGPNMQAAPVDLVEAVLNAVNDARVVGRDHVWVLDVPQEEVTIRADANHLHQVLANLLSNARKHTPAGTRVVTGVHRESGWAVVTVTDNGPGVPEEVRGHVFERFARADAARTHDQEGSTGLGLAIVAAVMAAHGGTASVDSRPGWTCFTLRFPLGQPGGWSPNQTPAPGTSDPPPHPRPSS